MKINTTRNYTTHETLPLPDCRTGDIVIEHCGLFKLSNRRDWDDGETVTFDGEYLGPVFSDTGCSIPEHWRENEPGRYWQVQGNRHRHVTRVLDRTPLFYWGWENVEHGIPLWREYSVRNDRVAELQAHVDAGRNWLGHDDRAIR